MPQFDVRLRRGDSNVVLECQTNFLDHLDTRFVVPLVTRRPDARLVARLNPIFQVQGQNMVMATQFALTVPAVMLGRRLCSLSHEHRRIIDAIDMLLSGL